MTGERSAGDAGRKNIFFCCPESFTQNIPLTMETVDDKIQILYRKMARRKRLFSAAKETNRIGGTGKHFILRFL